MTRKIAAGILGVLVIGLSGLVWAENEKVADQPYTKEQAVLQHILDRTGCRRGNCRRLIQGSDEEGRRRERWHRRMGDLEKTHPDKYRQVQKKIRGMRRKWLRDLKAQDPAKYEQIMEQRRSRMLTRLAELKYKDPRKYEKVMAFKEKLSRLEDMKREDPKAYQEFIRQHPRLKRHGAGHAGSGRYREE